MILVNFTRLDYLISDLFLCFEISYSNFWNPSSITNATYPISYLFKYLLRFLINIHPVKYWFHFNIFDQNLVSPNYPIDIKIDLKVTFFGRFVLVNFLFDSYQKSDLRKRNPKLHLIMYSLKFCIDTIHLLWSAKISSI